MFTVMKSMKVKDFVGHDVVNKECCFYCAPRGAKLHFAHARQKGPATELSLGTAVPLANRFYTDLIFAVKYF